jgi:esterase/lipase superfamily enzyme
VRLQSAVVVVVLSVLAICEPGRALAQVPVNRQLRVQGNSQSRSELIELEVTSQLTVQLVVAPSIADGAVRVFVFDASGVLSGLDDPEADIFRFTPAIRGRYRVLVANTNSSPITVSIRTNTARGGVEQVRDYATVRVLYATNRQTTASASTPYGTDPSADVSYGYSDVSIPRDHRLGELEAPSIWRLEFREDPEKHVVVLTTRQEAAGAFYRRVGDRLSQSAKREALVFVHGFNETFEDAVKRTAQIAYDLAFDGPAIAFSWPSQGSLSPAGYLKDQRNADVSARALEELLTRLKGTNRQITIHLVAHSMGNRVLARALEHIGGNVGDAATRPMRDVVMMAPDVDADLFRQVAPQIAASAERVTLYASSRDAALQAAQQLAGYPRAGEAGPHIVVVVGVDTIDASAVNTSVLGVGHQYYADNSTILSDLFGLIRGRRPGDRFGLESVNGPTGVYWRFRPAAR